MEERDGKEQGHKEQVRVHKEREQGRMQEQVRKLERGRMRERVRRGKERPLLRI